MVREKVVGVKIFDNGRVDYDFKYLAYDKEKTDRAIVTRIRAVTLLER